MTKALRQSRQVEARLDGVRLAGRELAHLLNNALVMPVAVVDLLQQQAAAPAHLRPMVDEAASSLAEIRRCIEQFQQVVRVETKETIVGPALDLERSVQSSSAMGTPSVAEDEPAR